MSIEPRAELGPGIVQVDHRPAGRARSAASNSARKASVAAGSPTSMPAPQAWAVSRQNATRSRAMPRAATASAMPASSSTVDAEAAAAPGRVLEDDRPVVASSAASVDLGARAQADAVGEPLDPGLDPAPRMRPDVDVHEPAAERRRRPQLAGRAADRALEEVLIGPGEVDQVRGMDRDRRDVVARAGARGTRGSSVGGVGTAAPGRRVVGEDLERRPPRSRVRGRLP